MPHLPGSGGTAGLKWNYANRLEQTYASSSAVARYSYDGGGNRVVKRYGSLSGYSLTPSKITVYLPGGFEISQSLSGSTVMVEWQTLAVMDDRACLARFEVKTIEAGAPTNLAAVLRYQLGNHLGSACLETTDAGQVLTREEYYPYGGTAYAFAASGYSGFSVKRYRYAGKECDSENGLYYFGARYFAAWLGRWTAGDPVFHAGRSAYEFCSGNPVSRVDPDGAADLDPNAAAAPHDSTGVGQFAAGIGDSFHSTASAVAGAAKNTYHDPSWLAAKAEQVLGGLSAHIETVSRQHDGGFFGGVAAATDLFYRFSGADIAVRTAAAGVSGNLRELGRGVGDLTQAAIAFKAGNVVQGRVVAAGSQVVQQALPKLAAGVIRSSGAAPEVVAAGRAVVAKIRFVGEAVASYRPGQGFRSFTAFKRALGPAGPGLAWHHIVEQTRGNLAKFGPEAIHNTGNLVRLPHGAGSIHTRVSGLYSSIRPTITGSDTLTVRKWLSTQSFAAQREFGLKAIQKIGAGEW